MLSCRLKIFVKFECLVNVVVNHKSMCYPLITWFTCTSYADTGTLPCVPGGEVSMVVRSARGKGDATLCSSGLGGGLGACHP